MLESIRLALRPHFHLGWNLLLALVPLVLALWLFRRIPRRGWLWWPLLLVFIAFLPNAAYTVTDIIHFVAELREQPDLPVWSVIYFIIPKYAVFMLLGFQSHVISLILAGNYLQWISHKRWVFPAELILNFLCAIGVYWGRYLRFNSWDIVTNPQRIADQLLCSLCNEYSTQRIAWYFVTITAGYFAMKTIDVALWEHWQSQRLKRWSPAAAEAASQQ